MVDLRRVQRGLVGSVRSGARPKGTEGCGGFGRVPSLFGPREDRCFGRLPFVGSRRRGVDRVLFVGPGLRVRPGLYGRTCLGADSGDVANGLELSV